MRISYKNDNQAQLQNSNLFITALPIVKYKAYNVRGKKILSTVDKIQIFLSQFWRKSIRSLGFRIRLPENEAHDLLG